jgi:hypothetical protein
MIDFFIVWFGCIISNPWFIAGFLIVAMILIEYKIDRGLRALRRSVQILEDIRKELKQNV